MEQEFHGNFGSKLHVFLPFFLTSLTEWAHAGILKKSLHPAQVSRQSYPFPLKLMLSQAVEVMWIYTGIVGISGANGLIQ